MSDSTEAELRAYLCLRIGTTPGEWSASKSLMQLLGLANTGLRLAVEGADRNCAQIRQATHDIRQVIRQRDEAYHLLETACYNLGCTVEEFKESLQEAGHE